MAFIFIIVTLLFLLKNKYEKALTFYLIFSIISPMINLKGIKISYEILMFIPILISAILNKRIKKDRNLITIYVYILLLLFSTMLSLNKYNTTILFTNLFGIIRNFIIILLIINCKAINLNKILAPVIYVNTLICTFQLIFPNSIQIFDKLYSKNFSTYLEYNVNLGTFTRLTGTFYTPILLGLTSLIAFSYYYKCIIYSYKKKEAILCVLSLICGVFSMSKTFLLGFVFIILLELILSLLEKKKKSAIIIRSIFIIAIIVVFIILVDFMKKKGFGIEWYLEYYKNPFQAFTTRYSNQNGALIRVKEVILKNLLLGVGATNPFGEFVGDSSILLILHNVGIIGFIIYSMFLIKSIIYYVKNNEQLGIILFFVVIIGFLSTSLYSIIIGSLLIGVLSRRERIF